MPPDHHPLAQDFPELKDKIHALKLSSNHFARLERAYEDIDKEIVRLEAGIEHASSADIDQRKLRRVALKDELYALLTA